MNLSGSGEGSGHATGATYWDGSGDSHDEYLWDYDCIDGVGSGESSGMGHLWHSGYGRGKGIGMHEIYNKTNEIEAELIMLGLVRCYEAYD